MWGFNVVEERLLMEAFDARMTPEGKPVTPMKPDAKKDGPLNEGGLHRSSTKKSAATTRNAEISNDDNEEKPPAKKKGRVEKKTTAKEVEGSDDEKKPPAKKKHAAKKGNPLHEGDLPLNMWGFNVVEERSLMEAFNARMSPEGKPVTPMKPDAKKDEPLNEGDLQLNRWGFNMDEERSLMEAFNARMSPEGKPVTPMKPESSDIVVTENDVLCGRGVNHRGNEHFRDIVSRHRLNYSETERSQKRGVARLVVRAIKNREPPGRFLKKDESGLWFEIGDDQAVDKAFSALQTLTATLAKRGSANTEEEKKSPSSKKKEVHTHQS